MVAVIVTLALVGVALYMMNTFVPMVQWMKSLINCVVAVCVCIWLLRVFGVYSGPIHIR